MKTSSLNFQFTRTFWENHSISDHLANDGFHWSCLTWYDQLMVVVYKYICSMLIASKTIKVFSFFLYLYFPSSACAYWLCLFLVIFFSWDINTHNFFISMYFSFILINNIFPCSIDVFPKNKGKGKKIKTNNLLLPKSLCCIRIS